MTLEQRLKELEAAGDVSSPEYLETHAKHDALNDPQVAAKAKKMLAGLGYNGRGVAMATVMGRILARQLLGHSSEEVGMKRSSVRAIPLHAFSRLGAQVAIQYLRMLDGWTRATHR